MAVAATTSPPAHDSFEEVLGADLLRLVQSSAPLLNEKEAVESCLADLRAVFCAALSGPQPWSVAAFGSAVNGFSSKGSDIDVVAFRDGGGRDVDVRTILRKLEQFFRTSSAFVVQEAVLQARVRIPILRLRYKGGSDVDLSVNNTGPLRNTRLLRAYGSLDERVADLGVAVKLWAKAAYFCGAPSGHLSSYAFLLMMIYFLQVSVALPCLPVHGFDDDEAAETSLASARAEGWATEQDFAKLFRGFFTFYSSVFRWGVEVVSIRLGGRRDKSDAEFSVLRKRHERRLHIEDPFDRGRNLSDVLWDGQEKDLRAGLQATHESLNSGRLTEVLQALFAGTAPAPPKAKPQTQARRGWSDTYWKNGSGSNRGQGHMLPRTRITAAPVSGRVLEWKGKFGWVRADEEVQHEKQRRHDGLIFLSMSDVLGGRVPAPNQKVQFYLFADDSGIGAEECKLVG